MYAQLADLLREDGAVAVATVIATRGSTPREVGAKMLVRRSGQTLGTVGGGCGEASVWRAALQALDDGEPRVVEVDLTGDAAADSGDVCGGAMEVLVERWTADARSGRTSDLDVAAQLAERVARRERVSLVTVVSTERDFPLDAAKRTIIGAGGILLGGLGSPNLDEWLRDQASRALEAGGPCTVERSASASHDERRGTSSRSTSKPLTPDPLLGTQHSVLSTSSVRLFLEAVLPPPRLVVLGAGHISIPLAQIGSMMGFTVAVLDDRPTFANRERFPEAETVLAAGFPDGLRRLSVDSSSYVVLVTRGHRHDVECLRELVMCDVAYLGMIGSRRRVRTVFDQLQEEGTPRERLDRVHAPIGLDIGARTPEEIALSIMAEMVKVRRGGHAASLREQGTETPTRKVPPTALTSHHPTGETLRGQRRHEGATEIFAYLGAPRAFVFDRPSLYQTKWMGEPSR